MNCYRSFSLADILLHTPADSVRERGLGGAVKLDLRNRVRNIPLPKYRPLLPLLETVVNSFHALEEARPSRPYITIRIERRPQLALSEESQKLAPIQSLEVEDNGIGFNDANFMSFTTCDSAYKASRGGKGVGRLLWLKAYDRAEIVSVYDEGGSRWRRSIPFSLDDDPDEVVPELVNEPERRTVVKLLGFRSPYSEAAPRGLDAIGRRIVEHCLAYFLRPHCPEVTLVDGSDKLVLNQLFRESFGASTLEQEIRVKGEVFKLLSLRAVGPAAKNHAITFAADSREVITEKIDRHLGWADTKVSDEFGNPFVYIGFLTGTYLDTHANAERTAFDIPERSDSSQESLVGDISLSEIRDECVRIVVETLQPLFRKADNEKSEKISAYVHDEAPQYRPLIAKHLDELLRRIPAGATTSEMEEMLHRVWFEKAGATKAKARSVLNEVRTSKQSSDYRDQVREVISELDDLGVHALAQYVVHRKVILEVLETALERGEDGQYALEEVIHDVIFPMRTTSSDADFDKQNLWLIDERMSFHVFLASDQPLASMKPLVVDSRRRPDLLIFDQPLAYGESERPLASLAIVEFKRPQRTGLSSDDPIKQVYRMLRSIRDGHYKDSRGREIALAATNVPAYCYIICDITSEMERLAEDAGFRPTPDRLGYYVYNDTLAAYVEIISYDKLVIDAKKRNRVLFDKLMLQ